jgi:hypothetical protein
VEGWSPQAIGEHFGLPYHTVRSWVRDFRAQCRAGQIPPFLPSRVGGDRARTPPGRRLSRRSRPRPTAAKSAWLRDEACAPGSPGCSSSCPC